MQAHLLPLTSCKFAHRLTLPFQGSMRQEKTKKKQINWICKEKNKQKDYIEGKRNMRNRIHKRFNAIELLRSKCNIHCYSEPTTTITPVTILIMIKLHFTLAWHWFGLGWVLLFSPPRLNGEKRWGGGWWWVFSVLAGLMEETTLCCSTL